MALTLAEYIAHIEHELGGSPAHELSATQIVNEAGRHLFSMNEWTFRTRPPTTLGLTASQAYIALPSDFDELVAYSPASGKSEVFTLTKAADLAHHRTHPVGKAGDYWMALVQPTQVATTSGSPVQRLELWPTPAATVSSVMNIWYRALWTELDSEDDVPNIPLWVEPVFVRTVRAFAIGYHTESIDERLASLEESPIMQAAKRKDARTGTLQ